MKLAIIIEAFGYCGTNAWNHSTTKQWTDYVIGLRDCFEQTWYPTTVPVGLVYIASSHVAVVY